MNDDQKEAFYPMQKVINTSLQQDCNTLRVRLDGFRARLDGLEARLEAVEVSASIGQLAAPANTSAPTASAADAWHGGLIDSVADAIVEKATSTGIVDDRPARAAIRTVADWLRSEHPQSTAWAAVALEQEINNG
jgi:hypothetical protein